jgi:very-short-patch-repair endonuclease
MSNGETWMAAQLDAAGIKYETQHRFHPPRRWTFDFVIHQGGEYLFAVEVEGGQWIGGHKRGAAADTDLEKFNQAELDGWMVLRFSTSMVDDGRALATIREALDA